MLRLVFPPRSRTPPSRSAALIAEYLEFERRRRHRHPWIRGFAGFALVILFGGLLGAVPRRESVEAASILAVPLTGLGLADYWGRSRLKDRLHRHRAELQRGES
jgi:hypothetical protein